MIRILDRVQKVMEPRLGMHRINVESECRLPLVLKPYSDRYKTLLSLNPRPIRSQAG